jgi:hypothetical protein
MENDPDQSTELMGDRPNGLIMPQTRQQPPIENLKDTAFEFDRGVGTLAQQTAHIAVAFWAAVAAGHSCTLFVSGTRADPRSKVFVAQASRSGFHNRERAGWTVGFGRSLRNGTIVGIATRWHLDDPIGSLLRRAQEDKRARQFLYVSLVAWNDGEEFVLLPERENGTCFQRTRPWVWQTTRPTTVPKSICNQRKEMSFFGISFRWWRKPLTIALIKDSTDTVPSSNTVCSRSKGYCHGR